MSVVLAVSLLGMCALALCGFLGRTGRSTDLAEWAVGRRNFGTAAMWFLQAGEVFTTFSFLGVAGVAYSGGNAATYAVVYLAIAFLLLYFVQPRLWRLGKEHGYLTQADYFTDRYRSPLFGKVVAVIGLIFLLPYIQLQLTGLGMVVGLVTGSTASGRLSMVLASVLTAAFVLWSGIRGLKNSAYFKDVLTVGVMAVLAVVVPLHYVGGGVGEVFRRVHEVQPQMLTVHGGAQDQVWWTTSVLVSAIAGGMMATPHHWPPLMAAGSPRAIRTNNVFMPLYQVALMIPIMVGLTGVVARVEGDGDGVLLTLAQGALPDWATGLVVVAAAASAMVPAGAMCIGISTLVAQNPAPGSGIGPHAGQPQRRRPGHRPRPHPRHPAPRTPGRPATPHGERLHPARPRPARRPRRPPPPHGPGRPGGAGGGRGRGDVADAGRGGRAARERRAGGLAVNVAVALLVQSLSPAPPLPERGPPPRPGPGLRRPGPRPAQCHGHRRAKPRRFPSRITAHRAAMMSAPPPGPPAARARPYPELGWGGVARRLSPPRPFPNRGLRPGPPPWPRLGRCLWCCGPGCWSRGRAEGRCGRFPCVGSRRARSLASRPLFARPDPTRSAPSRTGGSDPGPRRGRTSAAAQACCGSGRHRGPSGGRRGGAPQHGGGRSPCPGWREGRWRSLPHRAARVVSWRPPSGAVCHGPASSGVRGGAPGSGRGGVGNNGCRGAPGSQPGARGACAWFGVGTNRRAMRVGKRDRSPRRAVLQDRARAERPVAGA